MPSHEASLRNLAKARANWRPPRPWRSPQETRLIRRLVWQWFTYRGPGKWSTRATGRRLGVSHTYIQKLVREFVTNPSKAERAMPSSRLATFEQLSQAQEQSRQQKERGLLRPPRLWKWTELKIGDHTLRAFLPIKPNTRALRIPRDVPIWATGMSYCSVENPYDPLIAMKLAMNKAMQRSREPRSFPMRLRRRRMPRR